MGGGGARARVALVCVECGARNYHVSASRTGRPIRRKKFCPRCGRHTVHEQSK